MKKNITILLSLAILAFLGLAFTTNHDVEKDEVSGIQFFQGTWEEALAKAKAENKLVFIDAYAAWCGPCKILSKKYFTNEAVGTFYNTNFINYKMDMEKHAQGPRLARKFSLKAYPTLYFLNPDESIVHTSLGLINDKQLIEVGKAAISK
ncbi:MAG: thioredoxin family protein [Crocinitomicaceae bacterium]